MEQHNMENWDLPVPEIIDRMEKAKDVLDSSTGNFIFARDTRYVTGQFLLRTDGMFEQYDLPDLVLGNVPYPLMNAGAGLLDILNTYQYVRKGELEFVDGFLLLTEGDEYILKEYTDEDGDTIDNTLEICSTQVEVDWCACCENKKHVGE